ncbi:ubiquinone biosynthesis accessory factor UbiJ [Comamonadaceae bacterium OS-1]|nr:ubiquinone biosynthesis accessory factor UbiJ [Comamonadaceae bacterium OS-1]
MATQSPFSLLENLFTRASATLQPPPWVVDEVQNRIVLLLNHVLQQEPEATARLARQKGRVVLMQWRSFHMALVATPAGLLDRATPGMRADLTLTITETSPFALAQQALSSGKPGVRIEGDVQLAAEVNWLVDHVRWDLEEDLSRVVGDTTAHTVGNVVRSAVAALRGFIAKRPGADKAAA